MGDLFEPDDLRGKWAERISPKAVEYFENLARAERREALKSWADHAKDTGIYAKYVKRAIAFLEEVGLVEATRMGEAAALEFRLPIRREPPTWAKKPAWVAEKKKTAPAVPSAPPPEAPVPPSAGPLPPVPPEEPPLPPVPPPPPTVVDPL